ncbi:MarR family transcriptional regulator [Aureimonas sp. Leaf324]|jgi:DNA-binding MarR family transcriptional regulator|uniref:MarR family winged helix-turn-helix transcriptional regulator n=1 Tax=Aureimonas sp. Leaf324 TaxID=1736336 RepID=UPI0006F2851E|nr:MarR family transcriptional regulator [Aureimonas sp. Leaf324]KQQ91018.1 MarR family transcriptional regulator [Aureimonas sp. Leaf324]
METPNAPTSINHRILEGLTRVATAMRIDEWDRAKATGLNPTQLAILDLLEGRAGGLGVKDIAVHLGVSQPTATDSVGALERKGLLAKKAVEGDRRAVRVVVTAEGLSVLSSGSQGAGLAERAVDALDPVRQQHLLTTLVAMIRHLQEIDAIPIQRMCVGCRHFAPYAHSDAAQPHHCNLVDAAFGQRDLRVDCREHETADPQSRAATWDRFLQGSDQPLQANQG